jgi:2-dehydropantoate 2-reductase
MNKKLNILSIGAGAIGTYFGGSLALKGHDLVFLDRPKVAKELSSGKLKLNLNGSEYEVDKPLVVGSIEDALKHGPFDVALFALKSFDTVSALESLSSFADKLPPFLCLSNGVENELEILRYLGKGKVIYGTVTTAVGRRGSGNIIVEKLRGIGIEAGHDISETLVSSMNEAGLNAELFDSGPSMKWSKMITNLIANASSAILDMTPAQIFSHPGLYYLEIQQLRETLKVMKEMGIAVVNLPGTPVKLLTQAVKYLPLFISRPLLKKAVGGGRGDKMPSFHIDLHSGRGKSEVEYLNGAVVRYGEKLGIQTPANLLLNEKLMELNAQPEKIEDYRNNPTLLLNDF